MYRQSFARCGRGKGGTEDWMLTKSREQACITSQRHLPADNHRSDRCHFQISLPRVDVLDVPPAHHFTQQRCSQASFSVLAPVMPPGLHRPPSSTPLLASKGRPNALDRKCKGMGLDPARSFPGRDEGLSLLCGEWPVDWLALLESSSMAR